MTGMKKLLPIILLAFINQTYGQLCYSPVDSFAVGNNPLSITSADFNGDGKADLATANGGSFNLSILLGTGTGSFSPATNFNSSSQPSAIISADFNGDGKIDLLTTNLGNNYVLSVLFGVGNGTFGSPTIYMIPDGTTGSYLYPTSVTSGDFNGDSKPDLAMANMSINSVSVILNDGTGGFGGNVLILPADSGAQGIITGDFNGDSKLDLAATNYFSHTVSIFMGTGTGNFSSATNFSIGYQPFNLTMGDFNSDGKTDLAVANYSGSSISVLLGTGTGSFTVTNFPAIGGHESITTADFDGDGKLDFATNNWNLNNISVLLGSGMGSFGASINFPVCTGPSSMLNTDFDGNGKIDLAIANQGSNNVGILLNCTVTSIANFNTNQKISFYPNPTSDQFLIDANTSGKLTANLFDINGRHVLSKTISNKSTMDVSNLDEGIYTLTLKTAEEIINKKLIIVR
jgi:hypothetical protein